MADRAPDDSYRIELDGSWTLEDFSLFGREYLQGYALFYAIHTHEPLDEEEFEGEDRVARAFRAFPWRGGWSTVDFFAILQHAVPPHHRPRVIAINYASPGFIELGLWSVVARSFAKTVKVVAESFDSVNTTYGNIRKGMTERRLARIDVRRAELALRREEIAFAEEQSRRLAAGMDFDRVDELRAISPNWLVVLKVLMALFRRVKPLAKLLRAEKLDLPSAVHRRELSPGPAPNEGQESE